MIEWSDQFGVRRAIEFSMSYCGKWVDVKIYHINREKALGNTIQMSIESFKELRMQLCELRTGEKNELQRKL